MTERMEELLIIGNQAFQLSLVKLGVALGQRYINPEGEKKTRVILLTLDGLWNRLAGPAFLLRELGWNIKHPIKFNRLFRKWLKNSCEAGAHIVSVYEEEHYRY